MSCRSMRIKKAMSKLHIGMRVEWTRNRELHTRLLNANADTSAFANHSQWRHPHHPPTLWRMAMTISPRQEAADLRILALPMSVRTVRKKWRSEEAKKRGNEIHEGVSRWSQDKRQCKLTASVGEHELTTNMPCIVLPWPSWMAHPDDCRWEEWEDWSVPQPSHPLYH